MDRSKLLNQEAGNKRKERSNDDAFLHAEKSPRPDDVSGGEDNEEDRRKLEEKRAYNRKNAARARQRTKEHILELTARAEKYASRNEDLQKTNEALIAQVKALTEENQRLRQVVSMPRSAVSSGAGAAAGGPPIALPSLGSAGAGGGGMHPHGGPLPTGLGGAGMDPAAMHGVPSATTLYFPSGDVGSANGDSNQRRLLLQLLSQGGGDATRQGLPPYGFS